ncbi:MAG: polysaccharide biosynthesis C-terminal domain-containing protein [Flavobacteriales bacterium]|jgi:O-antigen/teichoic acid export membrane protein|nr:polysaccharide biosynthesis C-terminal domain-containing protein [Flavobacteriales bacterium]
MIRSVLGTVGTRVLVTLLNLVVVMTAGRYLGAEGLGLISLIVLGTALVLLVNNVVSGGGAVYLTPRHGTEALRWPGYLWTLLTGLVGYVVLRATGLVPAPWYTAVAVIATLQGGVNLHLGLILGRQRIAAHNGLLILQAALQAAAFLVLLGQGGAEVMDHVHAAYLSNGVVLVLSGVLSVGPAGGTVRDRTSLWRDLFRQGLSAQAANALQLLNYRYAYLLIERWVGLAGLGIYSVSTQLAEGSWLVPKSIGLVLYTRVSNAADATRERAVTMAALKASLVATALAVLVLLALPTAVYQTLFGPEIKGLHGILLVLTPGLLAMSASQALSHYLSGAGQVARNAVSSGIGAVVTLVVATWAVPRWGLLGAALSASLAYSASLLYQWWGFRKHSGARWSDLLPTASDSAALAVLWQRIRRR